MNHRKMWSKRSLGGRSALALLVLLGCSDGTGATVGKVRVTMQRSSTVSLASEGQFATAKAMASVNTAQVTQLVLTISQIQLLPADDASTDGDSSWVTVDAEGFTLDLMALPTDSEDAQVIAVGEVAAGSYAMMRLVVENATIEFSSALTVGNTLFDAQVEHEVKVPSGVMKTDLALDVIAGQDEGDANTADLLFGPDASFQNLTATGSGQVILNPVLKTRAPAE